jgi:hypothetical protein
MSESSEQIQSSSETVSGLPISTPDRDSRPIGRCHPEYLAVKAAFAALNAATEALRVAVAALGDCRAAAQAANAAIEAGMTQALVTRLGDVIDQFDEDLQALTSCSACKQPEALKASEQ